METYLEDITDTGKGKSAFIAAHGPGLKPYREDMLRLQKAGHLTRFSMNNWFDFFDEREEKPDYWILASSIDSIKNYCGRMNEVNVPVFYADTVDPTRYEDYAPVISFPHLRYDQKHFRGHSCQEILGNLKKHLDGGAGLREFRVYGDNPEQFFPPRIRDGAGFAVNGGYCCERIGEPTLQEHLMELSGYTRHYSTADTVAFHAIAFALVMGFSPIFVAGMSLDYGLGYANGDTAPVYDKTWNKTQANLINDITILAESAEKMGTELVSLDETWYDILKNGGELWKNEMLLKAT